MAELKDIDFNNNEQRQGLENQYMEMLRHAHRLDTFRGYHSQWTDTTVIDEGDGVTHEKIVPSTYMYDPKERPLLDSLKSHGLAAIRAELSDIGAKQKADEELKKVL